MKRYAGEAFRTLPEQQELLKRSVFIYPTDTVYGLGCNALDEELLKRLRNLKQRPGAPFSVIAPSKAWIREHCVVDKRVTAWLAKLPGPYTLIVKLRKKMPTPLTCGKLSLGVRIPDHWIAALVQEAGIPIVTTSANITGEKPIADPERLGILADEVDFIIEEGILEGRPSTLVLLDREEEEVIER